MMLTNWVDEDNFSGSFVLPEKCGIYNKFLRVYKSYSLMKGNLV